MTFKMSINKVEQSMKSSYAGSRRVLRAHKRFAKGIKNKLPNKAVLYAEKDYAGDCFF